MIDFTVAVEHRQDAASSRSHGQSRVPGVEEIPAYRGGGQRPVNALDKAMRKALRRITDT